jgi:hypothetical protein
MYKKCSKGGKKGSGAKRRSSASTLALHGRHRLHSMGAADSLRADLGKAKAFHLPLLNQVFDRASHVFDWHGGIASMLIKKIDDIAAPVTRATWLSKDIFIISSLFS